MATGQIDPRKNFTPRILPWLLAAAAFLIYALTLNHWVSSLNLVPIAKMSGWTWQPDTEGPLLFLLTYPFRWLSAAQIPVALNLFSAVCAAVTLGLLARSVAILPHDRTEEQRKRERNDFAFLTIRTAWLPLVFAVIACGLQLTFWERATNYTGDTFDLLLFAFVIWSLLEYRLDEREGRLHLVALIYGAGMAENVAMVGFLPVFVAALIWIRGLNFFNARFIGRMVLFGTIGTLFYFLMPLRLAMSHEFPISFWQAFKSQIAAQWMLVKYISIADVRHTIALLALPSLIPIFLAAIRWPSSFGDASRIGMELAKWMFHAVHAVILFVCVWVMFDPPFSPRHEGYGLPCLPFYYLAALSIGYFTGYFLIIFRQEIVRRSKTRREQQVEMLNPFVTAGVCVFAVVATAGLIYKNAAPIHVTNGNALQTYTALIEKNLPEKGILLCDSDNPSQDAPWRLFAVEAALARDGRLKNYVPIDTKSLSWSAYHRFLHRKFPETWPQIVSDTDMGGVNPRVLPTVLSLLSKSNEIYYLHPSIGYYFEQFYLEPHGAAYKLKLFPANAFVPPVADKKLMAENEMFWSNAQTDVFPAIEKEVSEVSPPDNAHPSLGQKLFNRFHIVAEPDLNALLVGSYLSRDLDFWGVELQRAGELEKAGASFDAAQKMNPENVVAKINFDFNKSLRDGNPRPIEVSENTPDQLVDGPFDEPAHCFQTGSALVGNGYYRQAIASFERVRALAPDNLASRYLLGQLYLASRFPDGALEALQEPMAHPEKFSLTPDNSTQLNVLAAEAYFQKNDLAGGTRLLDMEISRHPGDTNLLAATVQAYVLHGLFTNALRIIDHKLASAPDDPTWLFGKGYVELQIKNYDSAIKALNRVLEMQTNNNDALFNRAIANLNSDRLDAARSDYLRLQKILTNSFQVAYGLGEIAWRKHETNEAIRNYEIYLANANTNFTESKTVAERLNSLKH